MRTRLSPISKNTHRETTQVSLDHEGKHKTGMKQVKPIPGFNMYRPRFIFCYYLLKVRILLKQ